MKLRFNLVSLCYGAYVLWNLLYLFIGNSQPLFIVIIGIPIILILPGLLITLLLGSKRLNIMSLVFAVQLSVLSLLVIGLFANYLPTLIGYTQPLNTSAIYLLFNLFICGLFYLNIKKKTAFSGLRIPKLGLKQFDISIIAGQVFAVIVGILGTFHLNNGGSDLLTMVSLTMILGLITVTFLHNRKLSTTTLVTVIALSTLTIMLITSLRGWQLTGSDIKVEFQAYSITAIAGKWDYSLFHNAYNSCLSITVLPVVLSKLLHVSGLVIFKFIFQLLFTIYPVIIFLLLKNFIQRKMAFIGSTLLIALPSFSIDTPFITRQQVAFVFLGLAITAWFYRRDEWINMHWKLLFILMSIGVVLSHYSTSYIYVGSLLLFYAIQQTFYIFLKKHKTFTIDKKSTIQGKVIFIIVLVNFMWFVQVTSASTGLFNSLGNSLKTTSTSSDNKVLSNGGGLYAYVNTSNSNKSLSTSDAIQGLSVQDSTLPMSSLSTNLYKRTGFSIAKTTSSVYYSIGTQFYKLLLFIGVISICFSSIRRRLNNLPIQYVFYSISVILLLIVQIVLPNISNDYGVTRAFTQAYIVLALPIILALDLVSQKIFKRYSAIAVLIISLFLVSLYSGYLSQFTGGLHKYLSLNNSGQSYGAFYTHKSDILAYAWIQHNIPKTVDVHAPDYGYATAVAYNPTYPFGGSGILPFQVTNESYVLLAYSQTHDHIVYSFGSLIALSVNKYLYSNRNLIYSTNETQLYN